MKALRLSSVLVVTALALSACNGKPSAVGAANAQGAAAAPAYASSGQARSPDPRDAPVPQIGGKPMWAANRTHTAEENALYQFTKNGGDFAAKSEAEYVSDVHRFVDHPPRGIETIDRPNGDTLLYDPKGNVFAVVARNGAPRTMFKPKSGEAYWTGQKTRQSQQATGGDSQQS
jgi:pyocin large subunit-like protein